MIRHSVIFSFKEEKQSANNEAFFKAAADLAQIEGVKNFEILKQVSSKNNYDYGILMQFDSQAAYDAYNQHPQHQQFITDYWLTHVGQFLEIDFEEL